MIHWPEAKDHIGETVSICGEVTSTYFDYKDIELHPTFSRNRSALPAS